MEPLSLQDTASHRPFEERLNFCCQSDVGRAREENEDNHGEFGPEQSGAGWLFIVADGMGGAAAGRTASDMAVANVAAAYKAHIQEHGTEDIFAAMRHAVQTANKAIYERSRTDHECYGMGTTITVLVVKGNMAYTAHVGDSRIYRYRSGRLERMMRDHTRVQMLADQGIITPAEAADHPEGHVISRNLGGRPEIDVDIPEDGPFLLEEGDVFLLCSDGLHGLMDDEAITQIISVAPPNHATPSLIKLANRLGGYDNVTVSLVCAGQGPEQWDRCDEDELEILVDELALDVVSDTALFEAYDPDALGPSDFETSRLRVVTQEDVEEMVKSRAGDGASVGSGSAEEDLQPMRNSLKHTVALAAISSPEAVQELTNELDVIPAPRPKDSKKMPILLIAILLLVLLLVIAIVIGGLFFLPAGEKSGSLEWIDRALVLAGMFRVS